jgi:hypothetical protein
MIALGNLGGAERPRTQSVLINGAGGCMGPSPSKSQKLMAHV